MGFEEDRDKFENVMGGAFSQNELALGPEMHQTLVEHNRLQNELTPKNHEQFVMHNQAQIEAMGMAGRKEFAVGLAYLIMSLGFVLFALAGIIWAIKS